MLNSLDADRPDPDLLAGERQRNVLGARRPRGSALRALCQRKDCRAPALKYRPHSMPFCQSFPRQQLSDWPAVQQWPVYLRATQTGNTQGNVADKPQSLFKAPTPS